jgi:LysR family glycine cleavage system transcriptional activator
MSKLPSVQTLQAFDAAARHGSYTAAANELGLTHSAISHQICDLEQRLATTLFRREGRSMVPTREAVTLLAQVRQALHLMHQTFPTGPTSPSRIVLGIHSSLATCWLLPRIGSFLAKHPDIELVVRSTADLQDFLAPGIDIAVRYGFGSWPNAESEHIGDEHLIVVCSPQYRDRVGISTLSDLGRCALLRHAWQPWGLWFRAAQLNTSEPELGLVVSDSSMLVQAAVAHLGVALIPGRFAFNALADQLLVQPVALTISDPNGYYLLWRPRIPRVPASNILSSWLKSEMLMGGPTAR